MEDINILRFDEVIDDYNEDVQQIAIPCLLMDKYWNYNRRYMVISSCNIEFYTDHTLAHFRYELFIDDITAMVLNWDKNQLALMRNKPRNVVIKSKQVVDILRILYSIIHDTVEDLPIYKLDIFNIDSIFEDDIPPSDRYLISTSSDESSPSNCKGMCMAAKVRSAIKKPDIKTFEYHKKGETTQMLHLGMEQKNWSKKYSRNNDREESKEKENCSEQQDSSQQDSEESDSDEEVYFDPDEKNVDLPEGEWLLTKEKLNDFSLIFRIHEGSIATSIFSVGPHNRLLVMKRFRKDFLKNNELNANFEKEQRIMCRIEHPFLLKLEYFFKNKNRYYQFTRFMEWRDLGNQLKLNGKGLPLNSIKSIAMMLILAIEELHENDYVHRDIKPKNVLVDSDGYIKLSGFSFANLLNTDVDKNKQISSLGYSAPEILEETEFASLAQVDWWSLGILLYTLYYGHSPFLKTTEVETYDYILKAAPEFEMVLNDCTKKSFKKFQTFIEGLLQKDPTERLGYSKKNKGAKHVKNSKFFKHQNFEDVYDMVYDSPFSPITDEKFENKLKKLARKKHVSKCNYSDS